MWRTIALLACASAYVLGQTAGVQVNSTCEVGSCGPGADTVTNSASTPFNITYTFANGDQYLISGSLNGTDAGNSFNGIGAPFAVAYIGPTAVSAGTDVLNIQLFYNFANSISAVGYSQVLVGLFSGSFGSGTSVTGQTIVGGNAAGVLGPVSPPSSFSVQSATSFSGLGNPLLVELSRTYTFGAGTAIDSQITNGASENRIPTPSTVTQTLPHVADGNGFDTLVLLINSGITAASYSLQFFNQSGSQVSYQLDPSQSGMTGTIPDGSQAIVRTAGSGNSTQLGWGQLIAPNSVSGMVIYQQQASPTSFQEGSAPFTAPSQHFFFPFDNAGGATTSIGFVNPSSAQAATVNFTVRYATGGADTVPAFTMNPLQQMAQGVTGIWPNTAGKKGMIEVTANQPIGMVGFRFQGSAFTLFDTIPDTVGGSTPIISTIAHAADGNNFRSTFILTNSGTVAAPYTLSILNATGQPQTFNFDVASPLAGTVPAGSTLTIDTTGLGNTTNPGWALLSAPVTVSGIEVFRQTNPGKSEQQATVPISQTNLSHFFLPFDNAANTTSIALANPDPAITATINVTFRYVDGTSNTGQLMLPPQNYNANLLASLFSATTGKAGVAEFTSNIPIAVVEVRFNPTQAFTSLRAVNP